MKPAEKHNQQQPSKGERLRWKPLKEAKTVPLNREIVKGQIITDREILRKQYNPNGKSTPLVP